MYIKIMICNEKDDKTVYKVVVNHEEQYSIWPTDRENPLDCCAGKLATGVSTRC